MPNFHESFSRNSKFAKDKDEEKSDKKVEPKADSRDGSPENVKIPDKRVTADKKVEDAIKSKKNDKTAPVNDSEAVPVGDGEHEVKIQELEAQKVEDTKSWSPKDKIQKTSDCSKQKDKSKQSEVKQKRTTRSSIDAKKNPEPKPTKKIAEPKNAKTEPTQKPKKKSAQKPKPVPLSVQLMLEETRNKYLARKSGAHMVQVPMTIIHHTIDLSHLKKPL